ncbi:hypothetical protein GGR57DRAFT_395706 [Xylariaceae sp. FL1272]|nr:hypothetical protein GGR57DRAFT_395706 [Xylariaceae sp. FL1272]
MAEVRDKRDPSRYEIRPLDSSHLNWALAIIAHSNTFHSPVWTPLLKGHMAARCYESVRVNKYIVRHQIASGLSLGVFDKDYQYNNTASAAKQGKLLWDWKEEAASAETLLGQMDFPLVSVALAYDGANILDIDELMPFFEAYPAFALIAEGLTDVESGDAAVRQATRPGQILLRNATSTRADYEGCGLMKLAAHEMMKRAQKQGFRGIQIDATHPAVTHVWSKPPAPFRGEIVSQLEANTLTDEDEDGNTIYPLEDAKVQVTRCFVHLV